MGITRTDPSSHPITLKEAKAFLRVDHNDEDSVIHDLIGVATEHAQNFTGRQFIEADFTWTLNDFPAHNAPLYVPRGPLVSVDSITYDDAAGDEQTLSASAYVVSASHAVGKISLANNKAWPVTLSEDDTVRIEFSAGYDAVPPPVKNAIKLLVSNWFTNREAVVIGTITTVVPWSVETLLWPYRVIEVA